MSEEKTFLGSVRESVEGGFDWIKGKVQQEGSSNWLIAAPAMLLGFLASQTLIGSALGGGFLAQVAGLGISLTAGMAMGVFATQSFHTVKDWALDEIPNGDAKAKERAEVKEATKEKETKKPNAALTTQELNDILKGCGVDEGSLSLVKPETGACSVKQEQLMCTAQKSVSGRC